MPQARPTLTVPIEVQVSGDDTPLLAGHAEQRLRCILHTTDEPVGSARVRIVRYCGPRAPHSLVAQANLALSDRPVRAQVVAPGAIEAVAALLGRLRQHLRELARYRRDPRVQHSFFPPPQGRFGLESGRQPRTFPSPHPQIVRRKAVLLTHRDVDEAAFDMDMMDYDFHLFVESGTGEDSVLCRVTPNEYRLAPLHRSPHAPAGHNLAISIDEHPAPRWDVGEAVRRMSGSRRPYLFFQDSQLGRGAVLYRRYDGHFGLIIPAGPVRPE